ncbi:hypothetical protein [Clostridium sp. FS41]|uniref:hypothetical protein n=1 Tax=Clostridia TaxID=186801 RepID=UPI0005D2FA21|nr:hypothetical protein [Clostridium sp. FS41]KJJ68073.1 hypothetical protein CLFS41_48550 [Clostridium sp. FS41]
MKNNRFAHYRALTISAILAAVLWCTACSFYSTAISHCTSVSIKWEKNGVSPSELIRQQTYARQDGAGNQPEVTLWQIYPEQEIMASDKKKMKADVVDVFGDCGDISSSMLADGAYPARSDASGCAVSTGLAFSLWGSTNVIGVPVKAEGKQFYVRGIFEEEEPRLFLQAQVESEEPLSNMQLTFTGPGAGERAGQYLSSAGFPMGRILDLTLFAWVLGMILRFPAIILAFGILGRVIRHGKRRYRYPLLLAIYLLMAFGILAGLWVCMDLPEFPSEFIPAMWSDFEFWENLFKEQGKNMVYWMAAGPSFRDIELWISSFMAVLLSVCASAFTAAAAMLVSIRSYKRMIFYCAAYTLTLGLISFKIASAHNMTFCKAMYFLPCLWICVDFLFYCLKETLAADVREGRILDEEKT